MSYQTLSIFRDGSIEYVTLNRPEVRNAINPALIAELDDWARNLTRSAEAGAPSACPRVAVLKGAGKSFSAGADLEWMAETVTFTHEQNVADAKRLAAMFEALDRLPVPLVAQVHGAALGGGAGLVAVCDIVIAREDAMFGFTEVKLGLVPAVISPYVVAKIGLSAARDLFVTGARFSAQKALQIGLVHAVSSPAELEATTATYVRDILAAGPQAVREVKRLLRDVAGRTASEVGEATAEAIAARRVSAEGQEGLRAFLEKRAPRWTTDT